MPEEQGVEYSEACTGAPTSGSHHVGVVIPKCAAVTRFGVRGCWLKLPLAEACHGNGNLANSHINSDSNNCICSKAKTKASLTFCLSKPMLGSGSFLERLVHSA